MYPFFPPLEGSHNESNISNSGHRKRVSVTRLRFVISKSQKRRNRFVGVLAFLSDLLKVGYTHELLEYQTTIRKH